VPGARGALLENGDLPAEVALAQCELAVVLDDDHEARLGLAMDLAVLER
jgi:hypothetical protein